MLRPKLWSAAARRRFGLFLPGLICESSCLAAKRFPVRLTAAEGGPERERGRSHENRMLRPKLWSAAARRRFGLFLPGLICESSCLAAKRFPVRLTAARWAKARAGSIAREPYAL